MRGEPMKHPSCGQNQHGECRHYRMPNPSREEQEEQEQELAKDRAPLGGSLSKGHDETYLSLLPEPRRRSLDGARGA